MNTPANDQAPPQAPGGSPPAPAEDVGQTALDECPDCSPGELERIHCRAEGVRAQAEYDEAHKDGPNPDKYEVARIQYGKARHNAAPIVDEIRNHLGHLTEQLKCQIDDNGTVQILEAAWQDVERRLEVCAPRLGCCVVGDADFDTDVFRCEDEEIRARLARYDHRTQAAEECFTRLLGEPENLTKRVADLKAEVDGIAADVSGDMTTKDLTRLYARVKVASRHLAEIWWGFGHPHDYVDCLCLALRISLRGRAALSRLTGELKVRECRHQARQARCEHLRANMADGIIEEYERRRHRPHPHDHDGEHPGHRDEDERRRRRDDEREDRGRERPRDEERERDRRRDDLDWERRRRRDDLDWERE